MDKTDEPGYKASDWVQIITTVERNLAVIGHGLLHLSASHFLCAVSLFTLMYDRSLPPLIAFQKQSKLMGIGKG